MIINTIDNKKIDTDKFSNIKVLMTEKVHSLGEEFKKVGVEYVFCCKFSDNTSFSSFDIKNIDGFLDSLGNSIFTLTKGYAGIFRANEKGDYGLLFPIDKNKENN